MWLVNFLVNVLFGYYGYMMAMKKNREGILWGIICLFTGPVGLLILYFLKPRMSSINVEKESTFTGFKKDEKVTPVDVIEPLDESEVENLSNDRDRAFTDLPDTEELESSEATYSDAHEPNDYHELNGESVDDVEDEGKRKEWENL